MELEDPPEVGPDKVTLWRVSELRRAGFEDWQADHLAVLRDVDLHDAIALLERVVAAGREPLAAFEILS